MPERASLPSGLLVNGEWLESGRRLAVLDKFTLEPYAYVQEAGPADVDAAVSAAIHAVASNPLSPHRRYAILARGAELLDRWREQIMQSYVAETGFTVKDARAELSRAQETLLLSAEEAKRLTGETVPVSAAPGSENRIAFTLRVPVGVVCAIAPFNAPLNTVAHKVGPGLAAGNGVVLKPSATAPLSSAWLCMALMEAGLPPGYLNMVVGEGSTVGEQLVRDRRIRYFTFTGSTRVGLSIKQNSGLAKTHMELGSNSPTIVCRDADLDLAADLIVRAGFRKAGQVCTSVQRVIVEEQVAGALEERMVARINTLVVGDPRKAETDVGPMISPREAERAHSWVLEAMAAGARLLTGGKREGPLLWPTLLAGVPRTARVMCDEVFGPVVAMTTFTSFEDALDLSNSTQYGLQAGLFTQDIDRAMYAAGKLQVGGVIINDTSSYHADLMPYGGVKESGYGVEGPRYAVQDMTDPRIVVFNQRLPR